MCLMHNFHSLFMRSENKVFNKYNVLLIQYNRFDVLSYLNKFFIFYFAFSDMREEFRATPKDTDAVLEEDVVLECSPPKGHPKPVVKWKKDGDNLDLTSAKRIKIDESGNLVIYKAQKKDQGRYQCTAENVASSKTSKPMRLKVHGMYINQF